MKEYKIPYQYTVIGHATVMAETLAQAVKLANDYAPCPIPEDKHGFSNDITKVLYSYLGESFEIHEDDLDICNNLI